MWTIGTPARYYSTTYMKTIQPHVEPPGIIASSSWKSSQMPHLQKESTVFGEMVFESQERNILVNHFPSKHGQHWLVWSGRQSTQEAASCTWFQPLHGRCWPKWWDDCQLHLCSKEHEVDKESFFQFHWRSCPKWLSFQQEIWQQEALPKVKLDAISALLSAGGTDITAPTAGDRLSGHHFPEVIPPTPMKQNPQKRCVVCTRRKRRKESRYRFNDCPERTGLCAVPCFQIIIPHTS